MLKKAEYDGKDPYLVLLEYRNTPITAEIGSPNKLMFGKNVNRYLPTFNASYINTNVNNYDRIREKLQDRQRIQKEYFDKRTRVLPDLRVGDRVRVQNENTKAFNKRGMIVHRPEKPRSYDVLTESGRILNRNRKHMISDSINRPLSIIKSEPDETVVTECDETSNNVSVGISQPEKRADKNNSQEEVRSEVIRRSNREVKKPRYLEDYV